MTDPHITEVILQVAALRKQVELLQKEQLRLFEKLGADEDRLQKLTKSAEKLAAATDKLAVLVSNLA